MKLNVTLDRLSAIAEKQLKLLSKIDQLDLCLKHTSIEYNYWLDGLIVREIDKVYGRIIITDEM